MADALLVVKIVTDYAEGQAGLTKAGDATGKFKKGLASLAAPAAIAVGAIAVFGKAAVDAASRTEQAIGAVDSVFGKNAGVVKAWADKSANSVGLAKSEYLELASVLGAQLKNMGIPLDQIAGKTDTLVRLGADLAATYGGTTKEAVEALGSALRGETDPIERYGVSVKAADIAAQQAADGTAKLTGEAGKQAKTMALLALVNKQTADAQGQFNREQDTAAVQAQIAAANFEDMKAALGTALLPAITAVMSKLAALAALLTKHKTATLIAVAAIGIMAAAILALNVAVSVYTAVTTLAASATIAAWVAAAWPILAVIAAVALVAAGFVLLWKRSATFRKIVLAVFGAVKGAARATAAFLKGAWSAVWRAVSGYAKGYATAVRVVFNAIRSAVSAVVGKIKDGWRSLWSALRSLATAGASVIKSVFTAIRDTVSNVKSTIVSIWRGMWDSIKAAARGAADLLTAPFDALSGAVRTAIGWVEDLVGWISRIKIPNLNPLNAIPGLGRSAPAPAVSPALGLYAAPRVASPGARSATPVGGPTIVIQGALDPEAVARQVRRLLGGHDRRIGAVSA
jgi:hypothetical protein